MEINKKLEQFGLEGKRADVYLACLELGSSTVIEIARKAGIKRTTCYDILLDLIEKSLISETVKGKKRFFIGEDPENIKKKLREKENLFSEILPFLRSIHNVSGTKPKIKFYEGTEGIKEVYSDPLNYSGEFLAFGSEDIIKVVGNDWMEKFIANRVKKRIPVRTILPKTDYTQEKLRERDSLHLRNTKLINKNKYPFSIEIDIYGYSKISLISAKESLGIIIESSEIHTTLKALFEILWDNLPEIKVD